MLQSASSGGSSPAVQPIDLRAPAGEFRVIRTDPQTGVQTFCCDMETEGSARQEADDIADGKMVLTTVYDEAGTPIASFGEKWKKK